jgi:hypothetical protein
MALISDRVNNERFVVCRIADDDHRLALKYLPKSVSAMILHTKCQLGREVVIETTLIRYRCLDEDFSKVLFKIEAINGWLTVSKQKPVVNLIPIERFHTGTAQLSQNLQPMGYSQQQLQFAQLSQNSIQSLPMSQPAAMSQQMHSFGNQRSYSQLQVDNEFQLHGEMGYGLP